MKTKYLLLILIYSICISTAKAQEPKKKEMKPYEISRTKYGEIMKNINDIYLSMLENVEYPKNKMCNSKEVFKLATNYLKNEAIKGNSFLGTMARLDKEKEVGIGYGNDRVFEEKLDLGQFATQRDFIIHARDNNDTFASFVYAVTKKDIGELNEKDLDNLRGTYFVKDFATGTGNILNLEYDLHTKLNENCYLSWRPYFIIKPSDFSESRNEFKISVKIDCECNEKGQNNLKKSYYEYQADVNGISTNKTFILKRPAHPKINIKEVECCPTKEEKGEPKTTLNDSDYVKGYFQASGYVGLPLGEESDFYSLVFGADLAYLFNVSEDVSVGPGVGYTHFNGKNVNGFKVEGLGFFSAEGIIKYSISNNISIEGNIGYSFSTEENVDGGLSYGIGVGFEIAPGIVIGPEISFINLGDSGSFNSFGIGFLYAFWRK